MTEVVVAVEPDPKGPEQDVPGGGLLHPVPLLAIALLVVNDHLLKGLYGNWLTGKLSDVAGLVFFPLLLQGLWEVGRSGLSRPWGPSRRALLGFTVATGVAFAAIQLFPWATEAWRWTLGGLQWPFGAARALLAGDPLPPPWPVHAVADPTDLLALPALLLALAVGWRRSKGPSGPRAR